MHSQRIGTLFLMFVCSVGCQSTSLTQKESRLRDRVNDLYVDQAMDNLVRARCNLPFVIMDYRDFQFNGTDTVGGAGGFAYESASAVGRLFSLDVAGERKEFLSFKSDPVTDRNDVYEAYLAFASTPGLLNVTSDEPQNAFQCREYCGSYYWIPCEAAPIFMSLVMDGSMLLGEESAPPAAYERTILGVERLPVLDLGDDTEAEQHQITAVIRLDAEVPASPGTIVAKLRDGRTVRFRYTKRATSAPSDGELIKEFQATWNRKTEGFSIHDLQGVRVRVYSDFYPPEATSIDSTGRQIIDGLRDIRSLQLMDGGASFE